MSFVKDGEIKVFKDNDNIGPKSANEGQANRYTVDDLVRDSEKEKTVELDMKSEDMEE